MHCEMKLYVNPCPGRSTSRTSSWFSDQRGARGAAVRLRILFWPCPVHVQLVFS